MACFLSGPKAYFPSEMMNPRYIGPLAGKLGPFSRKLCCLPQRVRLAMPLSPPSIFPGHGLPGADHPCIGARYSLDFLPGKLTNLLLGLPQTRSVNF
jgi:hypothetical protein